MPTVKDCKNKDGDWIGEFYETGVKYRTKAFQTWTGIQDRCKVGGLQQKRFPTYVGCTVNVQFQKFQFFAEWCQHQIGYDLENYHIDKDILVAGNKEYHYNKCVFVPAALNTFFTASNAIRGNLPQGVALSSCGRFKTAIAKDGKIKHLGVFSSPEKAFEVYKDAKEELCKQWAQRCKNGEFLVDPRVIVALENWKLK